MRLRPVLALSALLLWLPSLGYALGLGDLELRSGLNQPMDAQIELLQVRDLNPNEIIPNLASIKDFERAGVSREFFLTSMEFEVVELSDGRLVISIKTQRPVREPFMNFLVEVIWPGGKLLREYTLLVDPPIYSERIADRPRPSVAAVEPPPKSSTKPVQQTSNQVQRRADTSEQKIARSEPAPKAQAPVTSSEKKPVQSKPASDRAATPARPKPAPETTTSATGSSYKVVKNDTLWNIADSARTSPQVTVQQTMLAIQQLNPDAFINDNINLIKTGKVLRMPSEDQIKQLSQQEAVAEVARQERAWRERLIARTGQGKRPAPKQTISDATTAPIRKPVDDSARRISVSTPGNATGSSGSGAGGQGAGVQGELATAEIQNELDRITLERNEAQSRLTQLESLLVDNKRLVNLQNQQISKLRERLAEIERQAQMAAEAAESQAAEQSQMDGTEPQEVAIGMAGSPDTGMMPSDQILINEEPGENSRQAVRMPNNQMPTTEDPVIIDEMLNGGDSVAPADGGNMAESDTGNAMPVAPPMRRPQEPAFYQNPIYIGIAVGLVVVIGLLFFILRRGRGEDDEEFDSDELELEQDLDDLSLDSEVALEEISDDEAQNVGSSFPLDDQIGDPSEIIEDADLQMAYGFYAEAQKKLKNAIALDPSNVDFYWKLLEVYVEIHDAPGFISCEAALFKVDPSADGGDRIAQLRSTFGDDLPMPSPEAAADFSLSSNELASESQNTASSGPSSELDALSQDLGMNEGSSSGLEMDADLGESLDEALDLDMMAGLDEAAQGLDESTGDDSSALDPLQELESSLSESDDLSDLSVLTADDALSSDDSEISADLDLDDDLSLDLDASMDDVLSEDSGELSFDEPADDELPLAEDLSDGLDTSSLDGVGDDFDPAALVADLDDVFEPSPQALTGDLDSPIIGSAPVVDADQSDNDDDLGDLSADLDLNLDSLDSSDDIMGAGADDLNLDGSVSDAEESLLDADEMTTKLDLARAYIDMGDKAGARDILDEVVSEGTAKQQEEANALLKRVS